MKATRLILAVLVLLVLLVYVFADAEAGTETRTYVPLVNNIDVKTECDPPAHLDPHRGQCVILIDPPWIP